MPLFGKVYFVRLLFFRGILSGKWGVYWGFENGHLSENWLSSILIFKVLIQLGSETMRNGEKCLII